MQGNNNLRVFSGNSSTSSSATYRRFADADLSSTTVQNGAGYEETANSILYNSFSLAMSLPVVALVDFIAQYNSSTTFGQDLAINDWITAVSNAIASKTSVDTLSSTVSSITSGTTPVGKANQLTTARTITVSGNGTNSSASFDGTGNISLTISKADNATNADNATVADSVVFTTTAPTSSPAEGTLIIYTGSSLPATLYDRVLYLVTYSLV